MVQLKVVSGRKAGAVWVARHFPVRIGRSPESDFQLLENGVWDEHVEITMRSREGFFLKAHPDALVHVNGDPARELRLRNGDLIELGAAKLRFWLGEVRQRGLSPREWAIWIGIGAVSLGQVALIYWMLSR